MAKRQFKRKRIIRKRRGGRAGGKKTTLVNTSSLSPIPSRYITRMKYAQALTVSGVGLQSFTWNLNSIFAPSRSAHPTNHQPYGYDQFAALYNRYRVFGCKYIISCANSEYNIHFAALPSNSSVPPISNVSECRENPRAQYRTQNPGGTLKMLKGYVNLPALTGRTKSQYMADDSYQSIYNLSPSEIMTLPVYCQGMNDDTGVVMTHTINILLEFDVELFDPISIDQS